MGVRRSVGVIAVATGVVCFGLVGCSTRPLDRDVVTANGSEPQNPLVPTNTNENGGGRIVDRLFAGLRWIDVRGGLHDEVAQSIDSVDQQHYTIRLKPGWTFSDGTSVTSRSFVDAWNYGALGTNAQLQSWVFAQIVGFDDVQANPPRAQTMSGLHIVDDSTFTVDLTAPTIDFRVRLAYAPYYPLPAVAYKDMKAFGEHPIGNGPYRMADGNAWQHEVRLDLVRNERYPGGRPPRNKALSFIFYQSFDTAYSDLQAGNLDLLDVIPNSASTIYQRDLGAAAIERPVAYSSWIGIQQNVVHLSGAEGVLRRRAISMAIDRQRIGDAIFHGAVTPARDFTASALPGYNGDLPGVGALVYNPTEAKRLWAQADAISRWTGKFQVAYNTDGDHQAWIDALANSVKNTLGIQAEGAPLPTFKQQRNAVVHHTIGKPFRHGWQGDYPSMLGYLEPNFVSNSETNDLDYQNPEYDRLIAEAEAAPDEPTSWKLIGRAQTLLLRDLPTIPIFDQIGTAGHSEQVRNAQLGWQRMFDFENVEKPGS